MFDEYKKRLQPSFEQVGISSNVSQIVEVDALDLEKERQLLFSKFKRYKKEIGREENKSELDRFLNEEDAKDDGDFDILIWWKLNRHRFPILSHMAHDVLAPPISTIASEFAFSTGGRVLDTYRSSLAPKRVEALICTQDWLCGSPSFDDIKDDLVKLEKVDLGKNLFQFLFLLGKLDIP